MFTKTFTTTLTTISLAISLSACSTTQLTSGSDYLDRYTPQALASSDSLDEDIRAIASVEPDLRFPARIGLARIKNRQLVNPPIDELAAWGDLADVLGPDIGSFVPVSPLIASMVRPADKAPRSEHVVADIRRAAARQHLDYVLVYEVTDMMDSERNALSIADLTILGLYLLPSRDTNIQSYASALLVDVRNGYPYGTASGSDKQTMLTTYANSGSTKRRKQNSVSQSAVENLITDVETMLKDLQAQLKS